MGNHAEGFYSVRLGQEELIVLLGILRASTIPGLGENPLGDMSEEMVKVALGAGERSLRARGLIAVDMGESKIKVDPLTLALIGTCVYPQYTISLTVLEKNGALDAAYYHGRDGFLVEHSFPEAGINGFRTAENSRQMEERLINRLKLNESPEPPGKPLRIPLSGMEEARELAAKGERGALERTIKKKGMKQDDARKVTSIFEDSNRSIFLLRVDYGSGQEETRGTGLALLEQDTGYWLMTGSEDNTEIFIMEPVSGEHAKASVREFITASGNR